MDTASPYRTAADRARVIAAVARDRFSPPETLHILDVIARHLSAAADHFAVRTSSTTPAGTDLTLPAEAATELRIADALAASHPATRLPVGFTEYVKAPFTGQLPFPEQLNPVTARFAEEEKDLRARLDQLHSDTDRAATNVTEWLTDILTVWLKWMRLADVVRVDNGRPDNQR
ncbi:hypothetical protein [Streptomyces sp. NBC_01601]|uniref:hypothetical protein n=1 Tax=Streptomyces sp. NBC_01601 TaxID=2975892 RepID=UPI002E28E0DE|nr:hypothetical protein [Streptomyces sp. NBC_01601]